MPKPKPLTYNHASLYYKAIKTPSGEYLLAPQYRPAGPVSGLRSLAKCPSKVRLGDEYHVRLRVLYVLITRSDLTELDQVNQDLSVTSNTERPLQLKSNWVGKSKPHNFEGVPMAGVTWLEASRVWEVYHKRKFIGRFKDYYDACNARMLVADYRNENKERGSDIYPAPKTAYIALYKGKSKVPYGYRSRIRYDKHQGNYRIQRDGKTVKLCKTLKEAIKEVDKWTAR